MDVLVIGGSVFVGRAVVDEALAAGADVTVFNRGRSGTVPDGVTHVMGDRTVTADLAQLSGRHVDLVVDTCGYVPADVAASVAAVDADHYAFVSTINVFPGWPERVDYAAAGVHDGDPDATRVDVPPGMDGSESYGWLKAGCEQAVVREFGERCSILRAGVIVGPHDCAIGRLPWWIDRVARGGEVLAPGSPDDPVSLIDARDLARFALSAVPGTYETGGPPGRSLTRADLLEACRAVTAADASFTYVPDRWLTMHDIEPWTELPLWIPRAAGPSAFTPNSGPAAQAGLSWRPPAETVADTWAWQQSVHWTPSRNTPGLAPERERELLAAWHAR